MTLFLDAALDLAKRRSWRVFPVKARGKIPLTSRGFKDATTDPKMTRTWADKWPSANIGMPTGQIVVIDVDGPEGEASLVSLLEENGPLPETLESLTGRGRQLFFLRNGSSIRNDVGRKLGPGIDVRGEGGYVVLPPSIHENGKTYTWVRETEPVELPAWLAAKMKGSGDSAQRQDAAQINAITEGQRNATLMSLAGTMRSRGMSLDAIEAALLAENGKRCDPQLPESEVRSIARSIGRYESGDPWAEPESLGEDLPPVPAFDVKILPESLRPLTEDTAERMQVPLDFPAATSVVALGGSTGRRARIQPKAEDDTWLVTANLWGFGAGRAFARRVQKDDGRLACARSRPGRSLRGREADLLPVRATHLDRRMHV